MITGHKYFFLERCRERGYSLAAVSPCIVRQDGDMWTVDERHPAYPIVRTTSSTTASAQAARPVISAPSSATTAAYVCDD